MAMLTARWLLALAARWLAGWMAGWAGWAGWLAGGWLDPAGPPLGYSTAAG